MHICNRGRVASSASNLNSLLPKSCLQCWNAMLIITLVLALFMSFCILAVEDGLFMGDGSGQGHIPGVLYLLLYFSSASTGLCGLLALSLLRAAPATRPGISKVGLKGCCPSGFRCPPASTHLIQVKWISSGLRVRCAEAGKHLKPAGQRPSRTVCGHPCTRH